MTVDLGGGNPGGLVPRVKGEKNRRKCFNPALVTHCLFLPSLVCLLHVAVIPGAAAAAAPDQASLYQLRSRRMDKKAQNAGDDNI